MDKNATPNTNQMRDSEERYHKMIGEVEDYAILLLTIDGLIQNWNKGAEKIKGYSEEEIIGKHFRIFYTPQDQDARLPEALIAEAEKNGKALHEGWRVRKNGTHFWGSIVITALHDDQGRIIAFSKVTRDLSERKAAEDKLHDYTRQLEFQNSQLQQFAYAAAHDMKEPLRKIQLYVSAIRSKLRPLSPEKNEQYLDYCANAAKRMQGLIEDILAFAKVSELTSAIEEVDLDHVWQECTGIYSDSLEEINAIIESSPLPSIKGINFQLKQLFNNLLSNALKYRDPEKQLRIAIHAEKIFRKREDQQDQRKFPFHKISFQDNGIGFDPAFQHKIFEMFERLHARNEYAGTGIGLAICKKIVENHGGYMEALGKPGEGATFNIYIPV